MIRGACTRLPGDNTLSNYAEANRAFWRTTILPLVGRTMRAVAAWLGPAYGEPLRFEPDVDRVEALSDERAALWKRVNDAAFLTEDEKRAAVGYGPKAVAEAQALAGKLLAQRLEWDRRFNPNHDERGRFASGAGSAADQDSRVQLAQAGGSNRYPVDLLDERLRGGHTEEHINKTPDHLIANVRADQEMMRLLPSNRRYSNLISGSFPSYEAASKLVNSTIARNADVIDVFLKSDIDRIVVRSEFSSPTGIEAYASSPYTQPAIRQTFGAGAVLLKDKSAPNGFTVFTAFPVRSAE